MPRLSAEQVGRFNRDGVLFPVPALSPQEVSGFRAAFEEWEACLGADLEAIQTRQLHLYFRWAYDLALHPEVLDAIESVLGPDLLVHSTTMFSKRPHDLHYVSWHQDGYYWGLNRPMMASAWIALSHSNRENGCMRALPGTHKDGMLAHAETAASEHNMLTTGLEVAGPIDEFKAVDVVLEAGQMSLHHVQLVHGSNPNRSDTRRVGFAIRYASPEVAQDMSHHEVLLARGKDEYRHFAHLQEPPRGSLAEGMARHAALIRELRRTRLAGPASAESGHGGPKRTEIPDAAE